MFSLSYTSPDNRLLPKKPNFTLKDAMRETGVDRIIETNGVYADGNGTNHFGFYRFWADGHVMRRGIAMLSEPTAADCDSFTDCDVGYFRLSGHRLLMELYVPHDGGAYLMMDGDIEADTIAVKRWWIRDIWPKKVHEAHTIMKRKVFRLPLTTTPDW